MTARRLSTSCVSPPPRGSTLSLSLNWRFRAWQETERKGKGQAELWKGRAQTERDRVAEAAERNKDLSEQLRRMESELRRAGVRMDGAGGVWVRGVVNRAVGKLFVIPAWALPVPVSEG